MEAGDDPQPTVSQIVSRARVSRKTFYDLFCDREDCFVDAYEQVFSAARAIAARSFEQQPTWREGVRAALGRLLALMDEHPGLTRLCVVHSLAGGERVQLRREQLMAQLVETVDLGRSASPPAGELPRMVAEAVVGGIHAVIHERLVRNDQGRMVDLLGPLMSMIVLPYLGPEAASQERLSAVRQPPARARSHARDEMRTRCRA